MLQRLAFFAALLLLAPTSLAQAPLVPNAQSRSLDTAGHLAWFSDDSGKLTLDEVRARGVFRPLSGNLSAGYTSAAAWLRFDVTPESDAPARWILEVADALVDDVRLYVPQGDGRYEEHRGGDDLPRWQWEIDYRNPSFHLRFDSREPRRFYVRLWTRHALSVPIRLWQAEAFDAESRTEALNYGIFYGVCGLILLLQLVALALTRERMHGWFAPYIIIFGLTTALSLGHFQQMFQWHGAEIALLLALMFCLWPGVSTSFALMQLDCGDVMPRAVNFLPPIMWGSGIACTLLVFSGNFGFGVKVAQIIMLASYAVLLAIGAQLALRGHRPARYFLVIFGVFYVAVALRYLHNLGLLEPSSLTEHGTPVVAVLHAIAVSLNIAWRSSEMKRAQLAEQTSQNEMLEAQIAARTARLTEEIAARAALELELRGALAAETAARQQQRDFVAMVTHEFRTPLAIIDTSAQRIVGARQASIEATAARCVNIRQATLRMTQLMDQFLSHDRLDGDLRALRPTNCNPREVVEQLAAEFDETRIAVHCRDLPPCFTCDVPLVRIALNNLLANALRYSQEDTTVDFTALGLPDGAIKFVVADKGAGIADDEYPELFKRYFRGRASKTQPGAGLGLFLVDQIARLHGGSVRADSTLGEGSRFTLIVPEAS